MGKKAQLKLKHRREEQKRSRARARAIAVHDDASRKHARLFAEAFDSAPLADRKALEAAFAEFAARIEADPVQAARAEANFRRLLTVATPSGRIGKPSSPDEFPGVAAKIADAQKALRKSVPTACPHLKPADPLATVCVEEPGLVLCIGCTNEHADSGHPREWDYQCLECGSVDMRGIALCTSPPLLGLTIRFGMEERMFISPVMLTGLGVCNRCRLAVGKKRLHGGVR